MKERNDDYLRMMEVFLHCGQAVAGKTIPAGLSWQKDIEPLTMKCLFHLGSMYALQDGTKLPDMLGVSIGFIDIPSMTILARAAFENYLAFNYIFVQPATNEEKQFRYDVWRLGGLKDRQKFVISVPEYNAIQQKEAPQVAELEQKVAGNPLYHQLPPKRQVEAIRGQWRFDKSWGRLAEMADIHRTFFGNLYTYFCSYAHTGNLSVIQMAEPAVVEEQRRRAAFLPGVGLFIMAKYILDYCGLFPESQEVLNNNREYRDLVDEYHFSADRWEEYTQGKQVADDQV
ncbi:DUF5677 domain-containing protein [Geomonas edaphica]|uniref:DUF5677 domain-containing protein n=1 Tax=Geomonas edaphica TaxID=2570226 RepID=UPI0010A76D6A|nr:DUF5677 domain-containing protein [Geomonas edaphica]